MSNTHTERNTKFNHIRNAVGGLPAAAPAVGLSVDGCRKWKLNGIPDRYWSTLQGLAQERQQQLSIEDLFGFNQLVRGFAEEPAAAQ